MSAVLERVGEGPGSAHGAAPRAGPRLLALGLALPAVAALVLWRLSLGGVDVSHLGSYGLPPALPLAWYGALLLALVGASLAICARCFRGWVAGVYIVAIVVILYGSIAVLASDPHYGWVYKHLGVTRLLEVTGRTNTSVDIYNRWPGFFALAAIFSRVTGHLNPVTYARWAEVVFVSIDVALIATAVKAVARDGRIAAGAALLFAVANWVGQDYYSPQAFGFALGLALLAVILRELLLASGRGEQRLVRAVERRIRVAQLPADQLGSPSWPPGVAIAVVLALDAVIVGSHQLTPYMLLAQLSLLILLRLLRSRWFVLVMALMTFAYLLANFTYIQHNFGLFTSIDPFNNVQHSAVYDQSPQSGVAFSAHSAQLLSAVVWIGAAIATIFLARRALLRRALPLVALAAAPFALIFGQSYGGEASLRVALFSFPWCAALISWALATVSGPLRKRALTVGIVVALAALFIPAFLGEEELNIMPGGEVQASDWFYAHAPVGSVLMLAGPDFPARYGPRYRVVVGPQSDDDPNLLRANTFRHRPLGPANIPDVIAVIKQYSNRGYLAFSTTETTYARVFRLTSPGALGSLEQAVAHSRRFRLWYGDRDARIYELIPTRRIAQRARLLRRHPPLRLYQAIPAHGGVLGIPRGSAAGRRPRAGRSTARPVQRLSTPASPPGGRSSRSTPPRSISVE
ncbi:MAG TPA: hypothetical protein VNY52_12235 [Solirubrobacteraceae bacterium]|nr:hypothetical protein [Solirubrobacteraceae bacterium]